MGASGSQAVSSLLFLVKEPTCQTIAWGGTVLGLGINVANTVRQFCNCEKRYELKLCHINGILVLTVAE